TGSVAPEKIAEAIAVEVPLSHDGPIADGYRAHPYGRCDRRAAHQPQRYRPARVTPHDVAVVLAAEVVSGGEGGRRLQPPPLVAIEFREPDVAVRSGRNAQEFAVGGRNRIFANDTGGRHAHDLIGKQLSEPKRAIRTQRDGPGPVGCTWDRKLGDHAGR